MTFSVVARDSATGDLGVAVESKFLAVGSAVPHAAASVGAVATQALANPSYGPRGLELLSAGWSAADVLAELVGSDDRSDRRQVGIVDHDGGVAAHTGAACGPAAGHRLGDGFACQGNILASLDTLEAMADLMAVRTDLALPERLVSALAAGQASGGDARGQQSAALLVVRNGGGYGGLSDQLVNLRVDDHPAPIDELGRLLGLHRLYFSRPTEADLVTTDAVLEREIAECLARLQGQPLDPGDTQALWARLDRWAGRENLEERMVRPGAIDRTVLAILRDRTA